MVLYHVGSGAAGVDIGVMDPGFRDHMFSQVVAAHIHQLDGVQGAAAQVGAAAGMGGNSMENKVGAHDGVAVVGFYGVFCCRMPGVNKVHTVKHPGPGHKLLGAGAFLRGAAEIDDGPVFLILF